MITSKQYALVLSACWSSMVLVCFDQGTSTFRSQGTFDNITALKVLPFLCVGPPQTIPYQAFAVCLKAT